MIRKLALLLIVAAAVPAEAHAATFAVITAPPTALSVLVLAAGMIGLVFCSQVWNSVKGGQVGRIWQLFMIAMLLLVINRVISLIQDFQIAAVPDFVGPIVLVLMAGVFLYGMLEAKRVFS